MNTLMRNMVLMCFSAFVLNTAILAYADAGYFADNKQKIKEYISSDTMHYYIKDYQGNVGCGCKTDKSANEIFEPSKYKREELAGSDEKEYINERIKER